MPAVSQEGHPDPVRRAAASRRPRGQLPCAIVRCPGWKRANSAAPREWSRHSAAGGERGNAPQDPFLGASSFTPAGPSAHQRQMQRQLLLIRWPECFCAPAGKWPSGPALMVVAAQPNRSMMKPSSCFAVHFSSMRRSSGTLGLTLERADRHNAGPRGRVRLAITPADARRYSASSQCCMLGCPLQRVVAQPCQQSARLQHSDHPC